MEPELEDKVVLSNIPPGISREKLLIHFQKEKNGGGDIQSLVYPVTGYPADSAVIKFCDEHTVQSTLKMKHQVTRKKVDVQVGKFRPGIFDKVTVETNKPVLDKISDDKLKNLQEETGVRLNERTKEVEGEWYQVRAFAEGIECLQNPGSNVDSNASSANAGRESKKTSDMSLETNDNEIEMDKDIYAYMKLIHPAQVDNLINQYHIKTRIVNSEKLIANFNGPMAEEGITSMQKLYAKTQEKMIQINYDLSSSISNEELQKILKKVQRGYKSDLIVSKIADRDIVMFIGGSEKDCNEAIEMMKALDGSDSKYTPNASNSMDTGESYQLKAYSGGLERLQNPGSKVGSKAGSANADRRRASDTSWETNDSGSRYAPNSMGNRGRQDYSRKLFEYKFPTTDLKIQVIQGDIAEQQADAIVNAANKELQDGGGVSGAIFRAGGHSFRRRCRDLMSERGYKDLCLGEIVHVKACGDLKCKWVLNAVAPVWHLLSKKNRENQCRSRMTLVLSNLIGYATQTLKISSISIPAIGTGVYGVPLDIFCDSMLEVIHDHHRKLRHSSGSALLDIRLVNFDRDEAREIAHHFKKDLGGSHESAV